MQVRARMLSWRISRSEKLNQLSSDTARLLFTWMIAHCDNLARMPGEPSEVKDTVFPKRFDLTPSQIAAMLGELRDVGLIDWYGHEGLMYVHVRTWSNWNRITGNMSKDSDYPAPPGNVDTCTNASVRVPAEGEGEGKGKEKTFRGSDSVPRNVERNGVGGKISARDSRKQDAISSEAQRQVQALIEAEARRGQ